MVDTLTEKTCTPCKGGIPPLTAQEAERFHGQVPQWELRDGAKRIARKFKFRNFGEVLGFVAKFVELDIEVASGQRVEPSEEVGRELRRARSARLPVPLRWRVRSPRRDGARRGQKLLRLPARPTALGERYRDVRVAPLSA